MSTTVNTILGLLFLVLAIVAVLLQAWLWVPQFWDDIGKKTRAPKAWLRVHRVVGYTFATIYVVMMWRMVPRLWHYQFELLARTVFHAVVAITLGVILVTKISIIRFFRHFEEAFPSWDSASCSAPSSCRPCRFRSACAPTPPIAHPRTCAACSVC